MSLWCRHAQYHLEGIAQSSGLRRSIYVEPVRTPFPQITAAPNQLRRTSSTFHRDSALCQQYNLVAYHLRLAVIQLISSTCFTASPPVLPARQSRSQIIRGSSPTVHLPTWSCRSSAGVLQSHRASVLLYRRTGTCGGSQPSNNTWLQATHGLRCRPPVIFPHKRQTSPLFWQVPSTSGKHGFKALWFTTPCACESPSL